MFRYAPAALSIEILLARSARALFKIPKTWQERQPPNQYLKLMSLHCSSRNPPEPGAWARTRWDCLRRSINTQLGSEEVERKTDSSSLVDSTWGHVQFDVSFEHLIVYGGTGSTLHSRSLECVRGERAVERAVASSLPLVLSGRWLACADTDGRCDSASQRAKLLNGSSASRQSRTLLRR